MASPVDAARGSGGRTSTGTAHDPIIPNGNVGDLLIVAIRFAAAPGTVTFTGWNLLFTDSTDASDDVTNVYWRVATSATGTSEPITLTSTGSVKSGWIVWRITGAADPTVTPPQASTRAIGTTTANTGNAPSISPTGGSKDYLFLTLLAQASATITGYTAPTGYVNPRNGNTGSANAVATNCVITGASKQATAASEDAGAWTHPAAATGWTAFTIAIHPGVVVSTVPIGKAAAATVVRGVTPSATGAAAVTLGRVVGNYDTIVQADAPLAYFKLEDTGATADEAMGGSDGTFVGTVAKGVPGPRAGMTAVDFDGDAGHVNATLAGVNTAAGTDVTVEWWQKWNGPLGDTGDAVAFVANEGQNYAVWLNNPGSYGFNTYNGDCFGLINTGYDALGLGVWRHIVATFRNNNRDASRLWIDGVEQTLTADTVEGSANDVVTAFRIGRGAGPEHGWDGPISRVAVWNGALAQQTIERHFRSGTSRVFGVTVSGAAQAITLGKRAAASTVRGVTPAAAGAVAVTIGKRVAAQTVRGVTPSGTGTAALTIGKKLAAATVRGVTPSGAGAVGVTIGKVGGAAAPATRTGTASQVDAQAASGSVAVTVPADATMAVAFWSAWDSTGAIGLSTLTLGGNAMTELYEVAQNNDQAAIGVATLTNLPGTGSQTLAWGWSNVSGAVDEGGQIVIVWVKGHNASLPARDVDAAQFAGNNDSPVSVTVDTQSDDLVIAFGQSYLGAWENPVLTGIPFIDNSNLNDQTYDATEVAPGNGSTTVTISGGSYQTVAAVSLPASGGGGGASVYGVTVSGGAAAIPIGKRDSANVVRGVTPSGVGTVAVTIGRRAQATVVRGLTPSGVGTVAFTIGKKAAATLVRGVTPSATGTAAFMIGKRAQATVVRGVTPAGVGTTALTIGKRTTAIAVRGVTLAPTGVAPVPIGKVSAASGVRGVTPVGTGLAAPLAIGKRAQALAVRGLTLAPTGAAAVSIGKRMAAPTVRGVSLAPTGAASITLGKRTQALTVRGLGITSAGQIALGVRAATTVVRGVTLVPLTVAVTIGKVASSSAVRGVTLTGGAVSVPLGRRTAATTVRGLTLSAVGVAPLALGKRAANLSVRGLTVSGVGAVLVPLGKRLQATTVRGLTLVPAPVSVTLGRRAATTTVRGVTLVGGLAILGIGRVTSSTLVRGITTVPGVAALGLGRVGSTTTVYGVTLIWVAVTVPGKLSATSGSGSSLAATATRGLAGRLTSTSSQASVASSSRPTSSGSLGLRDTALGETDIETIGSA